MTMKDANKTKAQLVSELVELRQQVSALTASDIELKRSEELLAKVSECFLSFGTDALENINRMTALCGELLGATCALYNRLHRGLLYSWGQWNTPPDYNPVDKPEGHICYDVVKTAGDKVLVVSNLSDTHYAETDPNVIPYKLQTYVGRAVKFGNDYVGSLCVVFQDDFMPSEMDVWLMEIIASAIGVEEKRKQVEETLQQKITELDSFLNNIPDMAWLKDTKSRFIAVNQAFGEAVEMDPESLLNQTCEVCFGEEEGKKFQEDDRKVIESGKQQILEEQIVDSRGKEIWLETIKSPILDKSGKVSGTVGIAREITKRKQAEEALRKAHDDMEQKVKESTSELLEVNEQLRESEAHIRGILNAAPAGVGLVRNREFDWVSERMCEMIGYSADELVGQSARIAYESDEEFERVGKVKYSEIQERGVGTVETRFKRKDGSVINVLLSSSAVDSGDLSKGTIFTVFDITERKQMEEALRESEEKYRRLVESSIDGSRVPRPVDEKRPGKGKRRRCAHPLRVQGIKAGRKRVRC
jgi:PAS domain S-box-containing protein